MLRLPLGACVYSRISYIRTCDTQYTKGWGGVCVHIYMPAFCTDKQTCIFHKWHVHHFEVLVHTDTHSPTMLAGASLRQSGALQGEPGRRISLSRHHLHLNTSPKHLPVLCKWVQTGWPPPALARSPRELGRGVGFPLGSGFYGVEASCPVSLLLSLFLGPPTPFQPAAGEAPAGGAGSKYSPG